MNVMRARRACVPGIAAVVLLAVAGCARRDTAADRAVRDGILLRSLGAQEPGLDPHLATTLAEAAVLKSLFEGLVEPDPQTLEPRPAVAERWEISPDGLVYTFHLRANARWSNGDAVTADDFLGSIRRALAPELAAPNGYLLHVLRGAREYASGKANDFAHVGVAAPDARTLQLTLESPCAYFLSLLTHFVWLPVHLPTIRAAGPETSRTNPWTAPERFVGNGPFTLAEYRPQQFVRVAANPRYWDAGAVRLREVVFYAYSEIDAEERAYRSGQILLTDALPIGKLPAWRDKQPAAVRVAPSYAVYFYRFNVTRAPLDDPRVRRALSAAVDRTSLINGLLAGAYAPARSFTPPGPAGYEPPALARDDADGARALLAEAGFPGGAGLRTLEIVFNNSENHGVIAQAVQEMWRRELGVTATLAKQDYAVLLDNRRRLNFDVCRASWFGDFLDPISFLEIFTSGNPNNQTGWSNAEFDRLVEDARRSGDPAQRLALFARAETILLEEAPILPVFFYATIRLVDPRVGGWFDNPLDQHPYKALFLQHAAD